MIDDSSQRQLLELSVSGKLVLFLGAGASKEAGLPSGKELAKLLRGKFDQCGSDSDDLFEVLTAIDETSGYNRVNVEDFLIGLFTGALPSESHKTIPLRKWRAIFTTNYDDLVELSYRNEPNRAQRVNRVLSESQITYASDSEMINIYKLMGCVTSHYPQVGKMVLTRGDYNRMLKQRPQTMRLLRDQAVLGSVLYVGYSFNDRLMMDVIDEILEQGGTRELAWSYAAIPGIGSNPKAFQRLRQKKVIPIDASFSEVMQLLSSGKPMSSISTLAGSRMSLAVGVLHLAHEDLRLFSDQFQILTDETIHLATIESGFTVQKFFQGDSTNWAAYSKSFDLPRDISFQLWETVKEAHESTDSDQNRCIALTGPAGCGKTVALRRLAWDAYTKLKVPVLLLENRDWYDFKIIDQFYSKLAAVDSRAEKQRVLILVDNASKFVGIASRLQSFLNARGRLATIIVAGRRNELMGEIDSIDEEHARQMISEWDDLEFADSLSERELEGFVAYLKSHSIFPSSVTDNIGFWQDWIKRECGDSFFVALYRLVRDFRSTFQQLVMSEYNGLDDLGKNLYKRVCLFDQYGHPIRMELLVRTTRCTYEEFRSRVYEGYALGVIRELRGPHDTICFGARHRVIAETIISELQSAGGNRVGDMLREAIQNINPMDRYEKETLRNLVARVFGANGIEFKTRKRLTEEEVKELFNESLRIAQDDQTILHHYGLFEIERNELNHAEELLTRAQGIADSGFGFSERSQHILVTLGQLYHKKGEQCEAGGDKQGAEKEYANAYRCFKRARLGEFDNAHAFHAHAFRLISRAEKERKNGRYDKEQGLIAEALQIIDQAHETLGDNELREINLLEAEILRKQGAFEESVKAYERVINLNVKDSKGYYLLARAQVTEGDRVRRNSVDEALQLYERAIETIKVGLKYVSADRSLLRLLSRVYRKARPYSFKIQYDILLQRYTIPEERESLEMLYDLGRLSFTLEKVKESLQFFRELEILAPIHPFRTGTRHKLTDEKGKSIRLEGNIDEIRSAREGWVRLENSGDLIRFFPLKQDFRPNKGDRVSFEIGFNFVGPLAMFLKRQ